MNDDEFLKEIGFTSDNRINAEDIGAAKLALVALSGSAALAKKGIRVKLPGL